MKKVFAALFVSVLLLSPVAVFAQEKVKVVFFTAPWCSHCNHMKQEFLPAFKKEFSKKVDIIEIDTTDAQGSIIFKNTADAYGKDYGVPAMVVGDTYLQGFPPLIGTRCVQAVEQAVQNNEVTKLYQETVDSKKVFNELTLAIVIAGGLIDSFNPCAFAVIVFFISFLTVYGYSKKEIFFVGTAYCASVFLAYFLMGFGLFEVLSFLQRFQWITKLVYFAAAALCLVFFFLSLYDFYIYKKTKKSDGMLLQLPKNLKLRINKIIGFFMRDKQKSLFRITAASFAVGFLVSIIEAACTGQVYIPTIIVIMEDASLRMQAFKYLVVYNLMFIAPLIVVFVFAMFGMASDTVNGFFKKHLGLTKILLALLFLALFLFLVFNTSIQPFVAKIVNAVIL
ncbi:thiol-disulfide isomerase/thioredoxin [Elusimicrobium posterum]|uniref:cytochrome c biogenesis protein n=1 Tax=Elusimicrobium posterum TaxID=3116653 RepID=UPI003C779904